MALGQGEFRVGLSQGEARCTLGAPGDPEATGATGASQGLLDRKEVLGGEFSLQWVGEGGWGRGMLSLSLAGLPLSPQEQLS